MSYQVVLDSKNKVFGSNNNATFDVNFDTLLPKHVKHFKVKSSVVTKGGNYKNGYSTYSSDASGDSITTYNKGSLVLPTADFSVPVLNPNFELPVIETNTRVAYSNLTTEEQEQCVWYGNFDLQNLAGGLNFIQPFPSVTQCIALYAPRIAAQDIYLYAGNYTLSFYMARRIGDTEPNPVEVYIGDVLQTTLSPSGNDWELFEITIIIPQDGTHTLRFQGTDTISPFRTTGIDNVSITYDSPYNVSIPNWNFELPVIETNTRVAYSNLTTEEQEQCVWYGNFDLQNLAGGLNFIQPFPSVTQCIALYAPRSAAQDIYLYAGNYTLSFYMARRIGDTEPNPVEVYIDDVLQTTLSPSSTTTWDLFEITIIIPQDGTHTLRFQGTDNISPFRTTGIDNVSITRQGIYPMAYPSTTDSAAVYVDFNTRALSYNSKNSISKYVGTMTKYNSNSALSSMSNSNPPVIIQRPNNQITVSFVNNKSYDLLTADGDSYKTTEDVLLYFTETDEDGLSLETDMTDWKMTLELTPIDMN